MVVQHNLTAMNSNRMLGITSRKQAKSSEKLSSGYQINRAADDAAGLSISEKMRKQINGLDRASMNAQDGVSAVQTAEGALTEVHSMLQRMNELSVQAANGTNSVDDREAIQAEIEQLTTEIDRVAETTKFNEIYLLKGDKAGKITTKFVLAHDAGLAGKLTGNGNGTFGFELDKPLKTGDKVMIAGKEYIIGKDDAGAVTGDGEYPATAQAEIEAAIREAGKAAAAIGAPAEASVKIDGNTYIIDTRTDDIISKLESGQKVEVTWPLDFNLMERYDLSNSTEDEIREKVTNATYMANVTIRSGTVWTAYSAGVHDVVAAFEAAVASYKADPTMDYHVDMTPSPTIKKFTNAGDMGENTITVSQAYDMMVEELTKASSIGTDVPANVESKGNGEFLITQGTVEVMDALSFNLHVGTDADMTNKINVDIASMDAAGLGIKGLNVADDSGIAATYAIDAIADAIQVVSDQRSSLGAIQNRLEHTIDNLDNVVENTTAAESRIRDTDMAEEMVEYSKNNILAQAGQSMLAQANQSTQGVLSLLQ